ncbi:MULTISPECIES: helix-turn-helix domain-containing protein [Faecalibacterium]|uniref:helix-turn-helix domain-containing protein n=1 Tax=Faecalibacterium TaxID=216851 RepID=UPI0012DF6CC6|nr:MULTISPECIES: helix-turn-helix transcriptional regulator [Faecalibacterium]MBO1309747.1 helix-turn-helix transcriptional regulator [Faecalibacterium sp. Marseille-Q4164]
MFSERLKRLRMEKGITQKELADRLHISRSTIAGYESLGKEPDGEKLCALADFFGVSVDYLLGVTDSRELTSPAPAAAQRPAEAAIAGELGSLSDRQLDRLLGYIQALKELPEGAASQNTTIVEKNVSEENSSAAG